MFNIFRVSNYCLTISAHVRNCNELIYTFESNFNHNFSYIQRQHRLTPVFFMVIQATISGQTPADSKYDVERLETAEVSCKNLHIWKKCCSLCATHWPIIAQFRSFFRLIIGHYKMMLTSTVNYFLWYSGYSYYGYVWIKKIHNHDAGYVFYFCRAHCVHTCMNHQRLVVQSFYFMQCPV